MIWSSTKWVNWLLGHALLIFTLVGTASCQAGESDSGPRQDTVRLPIQSLLKHARAGGVDYDALMLALAQQHDSATLSQVQVDWGRTGLPADSQQVTAFWIDAYNAAAIAGVIRHWPIESVMDVKGYFSQAQYEVFGEVLSLDEIEKQKLFGSGVDARLHFAIVCASQSCPPLYSGSFQAAPDLDSLLDGLTRRVINDTAYVRFDADAGVVHLSKLFDWYADHFAAQQGTVLAFIAQYHAAGPQITGRTWKQEYREYDWSLNGRSHP